MSRWRAEPVSLGMRGEDWAWASPAPGGGLVWQFGAADLAAAPAGRAVRVTLEDARVRQWVIEVPQGASSLRQLEQYARARFERIFEDTPRDWVISADWRASGSVLCQAIAAETVDCVKQWAARHRLQVVDALSASLRTLLKYESHWRGPRAPLAVWVVNSLTHSTLWWQRAGRTVRVRSLRCDPASPWARVQQEIERSAVVGLGGPGVAVHVATHGLLPEMAGQVERHALSFDALPGFAQAAAHTGQSAQDPRFGALWLAALGCR